MARELPPRGPFACARETIKFSMIWVNNHRWPLTVTNRFRNVMTSMGTGPVVPAPADLALLDRLMNVGDPDSLVGSEQGQPPAR